MRTIHAKRDDALRHHMLELEERLLRSFMQQGVPDFLDLDLTMPQLKILAELARLGPMNVGDIARSLGVSAPTVSGVLERLVRAGYASRTEDETDRRVTNVALTDAGASMVERLFIARRQQLSELSENFSHRELRTLVDALELLVGSAERRPERPSRPRGRARAR